MTLVGTNAGIFEVPQRRLGEYTTGELAEHKRRLEKAIRFYEENHPDADALGILREALEEAEDEQASRESIKAANGRA